jgi:hypothetical protein
LLVVSIIGAQRDDAIQLLHSIRLILKEAVTEMKNVWFLTTGLGDGVAAMVAKAVADYRQLLDGGIDSGLMPVIAIVYGARSAVLGLAALGCGCCTVRVPTMDSAVLGLAALGCGCCTVRVSTMDSAVLGLAALGCGCCTVRVSTMDSAVLGLASSGCGCCTVRVLRRDFALEDAIGSHACSLQALTCV